MIRFDLMPTWTDLAEMTILPYKVMQAVLFNLSIIYYSKRFVSVHDFSRWTTNIIFSLFVSAVSLLPV